ncbi:aldo/keto reductase [Caballeronia grimmiae]|uniref:aldo/keto reductase n=1 Tax=Caballeronia grimmiae TaxID=1071679 RepID=UPI0038B9863C
MVATIPSFGLGTFRVDADKTVNAVKSALQIGYRHIDTAQFYNNEVHARPAMLSLRAPPYSISF